MSLTNTLFKIRGEKDFETLLLGEYELWISNQPYQSLEDFIKKDNFVLAQKKKIKYDSIIQISKEVKERKINIKYKGAIGMSNNFSFSFFDDENILLLFKYLENEQYFKSTYEKLPPITSTLPFIGGLISTILVTIFAHIRAVSFSKMTEDEILHEGIGFLTLAIRILGDIGVLIIGGLLMCFFIYKIWSRFTDPPYCTKLFPPSCI